MGHRARHRQPAPPPSGATRLLADAPLAAPTGARTPALGGEPFFGPGLYASGRLSSRARFEHVATHDARPAMHLPHAMQVPPIADEVISRPGAPLDAGTRGSMEARLRHDFSRVRVHTDERAGQSARAVNALAYTVGDHIVFDHGQFDPGRPEGADLLAHELAHVIEQGAARRAAPSRQLGTAPRVLQRQAAGEKPSPPATAPPQPAAPGQTAPAGAPTPARAAPPAHRWTSSIPYIWFDLHDFYRARIAPEGPYLYSSYARRDRVDNKDFSKDLAPAPVRSVGTTLPSGLPARPDDLTWFFYTKFFVDTPTQPLPPEYSSLQTSATIHFVPAGGGTGFRPFVFTDNTPRYVSSDGLSAPFPLGTTPHGFLVQLPIMVPGTLHWDARLRLSKGDDRIPFKLDYSAPPGFPGETAFRAALARLGIRVRAPTASERVPTHRLVFSANGPRSYTASLDVLPGAAPRVLQDSSREELVETMALIVALRLDFTLSNDQFGSESARHVEISASQKISFASPAAGTTQGPRK